ncbi:hypothetical protein ES703_89379 [subsurface metagenome]
MFILSVDSSQLVCLEIFDHICPNPLSFPNNYGIGVLTGFFRHDTGMDTTHDNLHASGSEGIGDLIGTVHRASQRCYTHQVDFLLEINRSDVLIS